MISPNSLPACDPAIYHDTTCLQRLVAHLTLLRKQQKLSAAEVSRCANLNRGLVTRAEKLSLSPTSSEFKAWCGALGHSWESVWNHCI
jgi:transcriptional regulator with XRE-family HTH domain